MDELRRLVTEGLAQRAEAGIKVRQPLQSAKVNLELDNREEFAEIIREELNVKQIEWTSEGPGIVVDTSLTPELKDEGLSRDLIRCIQNARKNAGFSVEDRIHLRFESQSKELTEAFNRFKGSINAETLTVADLENREEAEHTETLKIEGQEGTVWLKRA